MRVYRPNTLDDVTVDMTEVQKLALSDKLYRSLGKRRRTATATEDEPNTKKKAVDEVGGVAAAAPVVDAAPSPASAAEATAAVDVPVTADEPTSSDSSEHGSATMDTDVDTDAEKEATATTTNDTVDTAVVDVAAEGHEKFSLERVPAPRPASRGPGC